MKFTLSNVFGGASSSLSRGFVPLLIVTLVIYIVPNLLLSWGVRFILGVTPETAHLLQGSQLGISVATMPVVYFLMFMHMAAVYEICVLTTARKPVQLGQVFGHSFVNAFAILAIYLLCILGWMVSGLLLFIPAAIFGIVFSVVVPAYITEKPGIFGAFSRSRALTKGHRWGIFGLWFMVAILFYIVVIIIEIPMLMPAFMASIHAAHAGARPIMPTPSLAILAAISVATSAIWVVILALNASVYSCLRAEKDGLSRDRVEQVFG